MYPLNNTQQGNDSTMKSHRKQTATFPYDPATLSAQNGGYRTLLLKQHIMAIVSAADSPHQNP
jgi:hypothetical protein